MLCRLNHELFPDPGRPIASTTTPLLGRGDSGVDTAGRAPATGTGSAAPLSSETTVFRAVVAPAAGDRVGVAPVRLRPRPPLPLRRRFLLASPLPPDGGWID